MPIYDKPTKLLMRDFAEQCLQRDQIFGKDEAARWFAEHYPKINSTTAKMHVEGMSVNALSRKHHPHIRSDTGKDWNLFYKVAPGKFRLWDSDKDPQPIYRDDILAMEETGEFAESEDEEHEAANDEAARHFALESDLRNYLVRNITAIETGLRLYEEEEIRGVEFPAGGRYIDILAVDANDDLVVVELKVSRGYERTIGQLLRYMGWVQKEMAGDTKVRGIIVANEISEDLKVAASLLPNVKLVEYEISFHLNPVTNH